MFTTQLSVRNVLLFATILSGILLLFLGLSRVFFPYDSGHYEGGIWAPAVTLIDGANVYSFSHTCTPPYTMSPYGLFYYLIVGVGIKSFGLQFWFARLLSVVCVGVCVYAIYKLVQRFRPGQHYALIAVMLFLSQFSLQVWIGLQRPDVVALTLSLIALLLGLRAKDEVKIWHLLFCAVCLSAAMLTRQTTVLPFCFLSLWLLYNRSYRGLVLLVVGTATLFISIVFLVNNNSNGAFLWQQYIMPSGVQKSLELLVIHITELVKAPMTSIAIFTAGYCIVFAHKRGLSLFSFRANIGVWAMQYLAAAVLLAAVTSTRMGSNLNYWLEFFTILSFLVGLLFPDEILDSINVNRMQLKIVSLLLFVSIGFSGVRLIRGEYFHWKSVPYFDGMVEVLRDKTRKEDPVYSVYPEIPALAERIHYFNDFCQYDGRSRGHALLQAKVLRSGIFSAIIDGNSQSPEGYYRADLQHEVPDHMYPVFLHLRK